MADLWAPMMAAMMAVATAALLDCNQAVRMADHWDLMTAAAMAPLTAAPLDCR